VRRPTALALAMATAAGLSRAAVAAPPGASGDGNGSSNGNGAGTPVESTRPLHLRLALSPAAGAFMTEVRVRSLLRVELADVLPLADQPIGAIDENAVRAWVDLPDSAEVMIQVQAPGRAMTRRRLDVTGLGWDVAARFTALATAEVVRGQLAPVRVRRPRPHVPTTAEIDAADRARSRWLIAGGGVARVGEGPALFGAELEVGHATRAVDARLGARLVGGGGDVQAQALEAGLSAEHRLHFMPWLRADLGASFAVGTAAVVDVTAAPPASDSAGYGRVAARVGGSARVAPQTWLGLRLEPGVVVGGPTIAGASALDGASLGIVVAISRDLPVGAMVLPTGASPPPPR
jgi:hypothetical protein